MIVPILFCKGNFINIFHPIFVSNVADDPSNIIIADSPIYTLTIAKLTYINKWNKERKN